MSQSFKIQQPIKNLATLQQEKRRLKAHIYTTDSNLRNRVNNLPIVAAFQVAQGIGSFLFQSKISKLATGLLAGAGKKQQGFIPGLLKATLAFAGVRLAKHFSKQFSQQNTEDADLENEGEEMESHD